ncbi:MAG: hypothetical protein FWG31_00490 [Oscillospiraceae bacterium]|nr:hypothetical protein [Oscillospiraceae bacterium]
MVCNRFCECHTKNILCDKSECKTTTNESNPTRRENGVSYGIMNEGKSQAIIYHVDGGVITGAEEKRCDYLFMFPLQTKAFFVELKGRHWEDAVEQLENTVRLLCPAMPGYTPHLRAVVNKAPRTDYIGIKNRRKTLYQRYPGATLEVKKRFADVIG